MIRAFCKVLALAAIGSLLAPVAARAAFMADPHKLYDEMQAAYRKGMTQGWSFGNQAYYLATIFNAGRAYALQLPDNPGFAAIERQTVRMAGALHYDPLIYHDAVTWYVRQAAVDVMRSPQTTPSDAATARALLERVNDLDDPARLATDAYADARAIDHAFPGDTAAQLLPVEAAWRSWLLTHDQTWRAVAFADADSIDFPLANLPTTWGPSFLNAVLNASHGVAGYSDAEVAAARRIEARVVVLPELKVIARVTAESHGEMLTTLAPADEYFGPMRMSVLGIENEIHRIDLMIGWGYAKRESGLALQVAQSIDDLHKVYPHDRDMPKMLLQIYQTLGKIPTAQAAAARDEIRGLLTVEYQDTPQARQLLGLTS